MAFITILAMGAASDSRDERPCARHFRQSSPVRVAASSCSDRNLNNLHMTRPSNMAAIPMAAALPVGGRG